MSETAMGIAEGVSPIQAAPTKRYTHPTGSWPKSVTVLALGPTLQDYLSDSFVYHPQVPRTDEIWVINKGIRKLGGIADLAFVMDDLVGEAIISESYGNDIREFAANKPVLTSVVDLEVKQQFPCHEIYEFPIYALVDFYGLRWLLQQPDAKQPHQYSAEQVRETGHRFLHLRNSIPLVLAYAGFIGVREVQLFGADYTFPGSPAREDDQPCAEFWCGILLGAFGINLRMSMRTTLLSTNKGKEVYGYGKRQPKF